VSEINNSSPHEVSREALLSRCRRLSSRLRPNLPPEGSSAGEFAWQCRALAERVRSYEALLGDSEEFAALPAAHVEYRLQRLETALHVSLEYFRRVFLDFPSESDDDLPPRPRDGTAAADGRGLQ
jgi:hypothetical protein